MATGNLQLSGASAIGPDSNGLFDVKKVNSAFNNKPNINNISSSTIEIKQALAVITVDESGASLDSKAFQAGSCKLSNFTKSSFTLTDCFVNDSGEMVYRFSVGGSKPSTGFLAGVQILVFVGNGELAPSGAPKGSTKSALMLNTFLFQFK